MSEQMSDAIRNMRLHAAAARAVDRHGWTSKQWAADAEQLMGDLDGSVSSLLNGHVLGLITERAAGHRPRRGRRSTPHRRAGRLQEMERRA